MSTCAFCARCTMEECGFHGNDTTRCTLFQPSGRTFGRGNQKVKRVPYVEEGPAMHDSRLGGIIRTMFTAPSSGLVCPVCGQPDQHNMVNGKVWCFQCNREMVPPDRRKELLREGIIKPTNIDKRKFTLREVV